MDESDCGCGLPEITAIDLSGWESVMDGVAKKMHSGELAPGEVSKDYVKNTYDELYKGGKKGYGKDWAKMGEDADNDRTIRSLKKNMFNFSGAKGYTMQQEMQDLMTKNGKLVPFNEFKSKVRELNPKYNGNYLQAEFQTARQTANHVRNWQQFQKDKDVFPNLKYMTSNDDRVRDGHKDLHGTVKPVGDEFWNTFYPPNGWRCRCYATQTSEPASGQEYPADKAEGLGVGKAFAANPAKTGEVYSKKKHPYFAMASVSGGKKLETQMEYAKADAPSEIAWSKAGATIRISPFVNSEPKVLTDNYRSALILATKVGANVELNAHMNQKLVKDRPNLAYKVNGKAGDRHAPSGASYKTALKTANGNGTVVMVVDLAISKESMDTAVRKITADLPNYKNVKEVYLISAEGTEVKHLFNG